MVPHVNEWGKIGRLEQKPYTTKRSPPDKVQPSSFALTRTIVPLTSGTQPSFTSFRPLQSLVTMHIYRKVLPVLTATCTWPSFTKFLLTDNFFLANNFLLADNFFAGWLFLVGNFFGWQFLCWLFSFVASAANTRQQLYTCLEEVSWPTYSFLQLVHNELCHSAPLACSCPFPPSTQPVRVAGYVVCRHV